MRPVCNSDAKAGAPGWSGACSLAVVADIEGHHPPSDEAEDESSGTPLQPNPDGVAEQDDDHGNSDDGHDPDMGAEAFHRSASPAMGVHKSDIGGLTVPSLLEGSVAVVALDATGAFKPTLLKPLWRREHGLADIRLDERED